MKHSASDYSVFGGLPVFHNPLVVGQPSLCDRDVLLERVAQVWESGWVSNGGPMVSEFERRLCDQFKVRHVIAVCNGTMALQIMAKACQLTGEVIVPSMTFIATAHALQWIGLVPVFADVDPETHTLDPQSVEQCISEQTSAILGVHLWGNPCDVDGLQVLADRYGVRLMFDASHAAGCTARQVPIGSFGDAEAFSFHATKILHSVEGGAITTNCDDVARRCRLYRNFGITGLTEIASSGINGKMNELCAVAGISSLEQLQTAIDINFTNFSVYQEVLKTIPGMRLATQPRTMGGNAHYIVVEIDETEFGLSRDQLVDVLRAEGVFVRSYFAPGCHNAAPYGLKYEHAPVPLPVTNSLLNTVMQFPQGPHVSADQIQCVGHLLQHIHEHSAEIVRRLSLAKGIQHWHPGDPARPSSTPAEAA